MLLKEENREVTGKITTRPEQPWGYLLEATVDRIVHNDSDEIYEIHLKLKHGEIIGLRATVVAKGRIAYPKLEVLTDYNIGRAKVD
jgi:hypothetical protein